MVIDVIVRITTLGLWLWLMHRVITVWYAHNDIFNKIIKEELVDLEVEELMHDNSLNKREYRKCV